MSKRRSFIISESKDELLRAVAYLEDRKPPDIIRGLLYDYLDAARASQTEAIDELLAAAKWLREVEAAPKTRHLEVVK